MEIGSGIALAGFFLAIGIYCAGGMIGSGIEDGIRYFVEEWRRQKL